MTFRITMARLQYAVDCLNRTVGAPLEMWKRDKDGELVRDDEGRLVAHMETYTLCVGNGGVQLETNRQSHIVIPRCTKRQMWDRIHSYIDGIEEGMALADQSRVAATSH